MTQLKVGLIVDGVEVDPYVFELAEWLAGHEGIEPVVLTGHVPAPAAESLSTRVRRRWSERGPVGFANLALFSALRRLIVRLETPRARKRFPRYGTTRSLDALGLPTLPISGDWSPSGLVFRLDAASEARLAEAGLDLILRGGSGILKGAILTAARHGIWSFHHGDNRAVRGAPSGFWEVLKEMPSSGFVIQRLTEELDGGEILMRGNLMTQKLWLTNDAVLMEKSGVFLRRLIERLAAGEVPVPETAPALCDTPLMAMRDDPGTLLRYLGRVWGPVVSERLTALFRGPLTDRWSVAVKAGGGPGDALSRYDEIETPAGRMLADPFVITHGGRSIAFAEDLFYADGRGRISAIDLATREVLGVVLDEPFHLSFPFVFEARGQVWMIPETADAKEIRLYRAVDFPMEWEFAGVLMGHVEAADTMLVERDGRWFMLTNICSAEIGDLSSELHVFHADRFDATDWTPVASGNPVIFDARAARNGGLIRDGETLIRVNQIQGQDHYGAGFGLNVITQLDEEGYAETRTDRIGPDFAENAVSTHHFHRNSDYAAVDLARRVRLRDMLREG